MVSVYVIEWFYHDRSGSGVMEYAYTSKEEAARALKMLTEHGNRQYMLRELKLLGA